MSNKEELKEYFEKSAAQRLRRKARNRYYHSQIEKYYSFFIPEKSRVIEIGCGTGELLDAVKPEYGVGIDFSENMIEIAKKNFPHLVFDVQDAENVEIKERFDYIIYSDLIGSLWDVQKAIGELQKISDEKTKIIISYYNYLWEPVLILGELLNLKMKQPKQNWLSTFDVKNLLELEGFEVIKMQRKILFPKKIPLLSSLLNRFVANLMVINRLCLVYFVIARKKVEKSKERSVSIVIPAMNEKGNIEHAVQRIPEFGANQELIFVEGHSNDGTYEEIVRVKELYPHKNIVLLKQISKGKGKAVREGFAQASGDVLMILDADLTVPPEDLSKFYDAIKSNRGEFINGCRLVYQMEKQAMRFLNLMGNKFFSVLFSTFLGQRLRDTLCGTKVLYRQDYEKITRSRAYFGDFDPFGDFELLFGASKLNLKIVEVPIRYQERAYGETQIRRFYHGWLLLKMSFFAARKMKFI